MFQEALERDLAARPAFLDASCAGDAELRARVEALLAAHDEAGSFLESPTQVDRVAAEVLGAAGSRSLAAGSRVGPYEIVALLGAGGMGEVYRARDERFGRDVAVKVLPRHHDADPEGAPRFAREARAVGSISHPNILTVFDVGWEEGSPYLVSELLEGETLGQRLRSGRLSLRECVDLAVQIARGLGAAHDKGVVHRDLKPDNVFLTRQGPVKLLDFGVAKLLEAQPERDSRAPSSKGPGGSTLMGTPGYMAPEQMEGRADQRSDLFALGALLYRTLTGRSASVEPSTSAAPEAVPAAPAFLRADDVPASLQGIVARCLERRPEDRFQSAAELRLALERFGDAEEARTPRRRRHSRRTAAAALTAAMFVGALPQRGSRLAPEGKPVRSLAVLPFRGEGEAAGQDYLVDGATEGLIAEIARTNPAGVRLIARSSVMPFKAAGASLSEVARQLDVDAVVQGTFARTGSRVRLQVRLARAPSGEPRWAGTYEGSVGEITWIQRQIARAVAIEVAPGGDAGPEPPRRRPPRTAEAYEAYLRGRYYWNLRTEESVRKAIDEFNRALALDPLYATAYTGLADAFATLSDMLYLMPSRDAYARAEAASLRALSLDPLQVEAHATLGHLRMHAWRWAEAEQEFRRAIELDGDYATAHHWRAWNLVCTGRPEEAVAAIDTARRLDPLSLIINADAAHIRYFARRYDEAVEQSRRTLQMNPDFQEARRILFLALLRTHQEGEALRELETFHASPHGGPGPSVGYAYAVLGHRARALAVLRQQEARPQRQFVPPYNLAVIHAGLGDVERAFALLDESIADNDTESMILAADPRLDSLREDLRFEALVRRMGLSLRRKGEG